ncbi:MAG: hypothetical protein WAM73_11515 [Desulfobacterales bacterium]
MMDVILYNAEDGKVQLEVQLEKDTVWLTQGPNGQPVRPGALGRHQAFAQCF